LFPEYIPSVRFNKAPQVQNSLSALTAPSHAAAAQTCFYNAFAGCLNGAAANMQMIMSAWCNMRMMPST
jgi:hypothetical protein